MHIHIPSFNFAEMRPFGSFWSTVSNGCHGNGDRYKNVGSDFQHTFASSMTIKKFHYHQVKGKRLSQIKIPKSLVSEHLK